MDSKKSKNKNIKLIKRILITMIGKQSLKMIFPLNINEMYLKGVNKLNKNSTILKGSLFPFLVVFLIHL